jgi:hypothetical protein
MQKKTKVLKSSLKSKCFQYHLLLLKDYNFVIFDKSNNNVNADFIKLYILDRKINIVLEKTYAREQSIKFITEDSKRIEELDNYIKIKEKDEFELIFNNGNKMSPLTPPPLKTTCPQLSPTKLINTKRDINLKKNLDTYNEAKKIKIKKITKILVEKKPITKSTKYYCNLLKSFTKEEKIELYHICMEDKTLAQYAMRIQSTFFEGAKGGFEENIGGNGSMNSNYGAKYSN